jgi:hypothetical protein
LLLVLLLLLLLLLPQWLVCPLFHSSGVHCMQQLPAARPGAAAALLLC